MGEKYANFRGMKKITVYEIHVNEGNGVTGDPIYLEIYYVKEDGTIIGHSTEHPLRLFAGESD
jgi:predicted RNA-binding protein with PIN domain